MDPPYIIASIPRAHSAQDLILLPPLELWFSVTFFSLQPGAKLARAHPPKYRSITSLQITVYTPPAEISALTNQAWCFSTMVRLTIDIVSVYAHCSTHLPSLLLPRQEGCLCRQLAARCEYIWRSSESGQRRRKHQVSAEPKVRFQVKLVLYAIQTSFSKITMRNVLHRVPWLSFPLWVITLLWHPCIGKNQYSQAHSEETEAEPLIAAKQAGCNAAGVLQAHDNHLSCQNYLHLHGKTIASSSPWQSDGSSAGQSQG